MTHDHLTQILQRYREFFDPKALDPVQFTNPRSEKTLMLIPPLLFQKLAFPLSYGDKHKSKEDRTQAAKGQWHELPYLSLKVDTGSDECLVIGHEGRHRTIWMNSHDIELIPVMFWVVREKKTHEGDRLRWGRDAYRPKFIRSQNKHHVFPMPVSLAYPRLQT